MKNRVALLYDLVRKQKLMKANDHLGETPFPDLGSVYVPQLTFIALSTSLKVRLRALIKP